MGSKTGHHWLTPIILATWEAEIRRISVPGHFEQKGCETLSQKKKVGQSSTPIVPGQCVK
jgi:hypothetical protein